MYLQSRNRTSNAFILFVSLLLMHVYLQIQLVAGSWKWHHIRVTSAANAPSGCIFAFRRRVTIKSAPLALPQPQVRANGCQLTPDRSKARVQNAMRANGGSWPTIALPVLRVRALQLNLYVYVRMDFRHKYTVLHCYVNPTHTSAHW